MSIQEQNTYNRIVNAAARLFAVKGYDGTTTREIVKEAGSSLSSLQLHFQSKESVYRAAVIQALERQHSLLKPLLDEIDLAEAQGVLSHDTSWNFIVNMIDRLTEWVFSPEEHNAILLMNREMSHPSPIFEKAPVNAMAMHRYFQKLFEAYAGIPDGFAARFLSFSTVMSMLNFAIYPSLLSQILECDSTSADNLIQIKFHMKSYLLTSIQTYLDTFSTAGEPADSSDSVL
ncbi:MAG: TetR/AcrR family transcriptional regulator [Eubacteriales bacterium]|nr:TetR/AcrR family transcriptional regulator [Eubacteriales bacterium]